MNINDIKWSIHFYGKDTKCPKRYMGYELAAEYGDERHRQVLTHESLEAYGKDRAFAYIGYKAWKILKEFGFHTDIHMDYDDSAYRFCEALGVPVPEAQHPQKFIIMDDVANPVKKAQYDKFLAKAGTDFLWEPIWKTTES